MAAHSLRLLPWYTLEHVRMCRVSMQRPGAIPPSLPVCLSQLIVMNPLASRSDTLDATPSSLVRPAANVYGTLTVGQTPVGPVHHSGCSMALLRPATVLPRGQLG